MAEKKWKQFMDLTGLGMKRAGEYFFPGKCYNNVLIKRNFADGKGVLFMVKIIKIILLSLTPQRHV